MTNKERTQAIRAELKKAGYGTKQVSVRSRYCGYSDATDITVKDINCNIEEIRKICEKFEKIDYDKYSGEILEGGNTYISVQWDWKVIHNATEDKVAEAEKLVNETKNGTTIFQNEKLKFVLCYDEKRDLYDIAEFENSERFGKIKIIPCVKNQMVYTVARAMATNFQELLA